MEYIPTECGALDAMLGGGIETSCITLLYGEAGTGKTNLCLVLARNVARSGKKVIYVDSEGVSVERLRQISGKDYEEVTRNVLFSEVHSFTEQETMVDKAIKLAEGNPGFWHDHHRFHDHVLSAHVAGGGAQREKVDRRHERAPADPGKEEGIAGRGHLPGVH